MKLYRDMTEEERRISDANYQKSLEYAKTVAENRMKDWDSLSKQEQNSWHKKNG